MCEFVAIQEYIEHVMRNKYHRANLSLASICYKCSQNIYALSSILQLIYAVFGSLLSMAVDSCRYIVKPVFKTTWEIGTTWELRIATFLYKLQFIFRGLQQTY